MYTCHILFTVYILYGHTICMQNYIYTYTFDRILWTHYICWHITYYEYEPCVYISYILYTYYTQAHCRYLYIIKTSYRHNIALHYLHYADTGQPGLGDKLAPESTPAIPHDPWHIHTIGKDNIFCYFFTLWRDLWIQAWEHVHVNWNFTLEMWALNLSVTSFIAWVKCLEFAVGDSDSSGRMLMSF